MRFDNVRSRLENNIVYLRNFKLAQKLDDFLDSTVCNYRGLLFQSESG